MHPPSMELHVGPTRETHKQQALVSNEHRCDRVQLGRAQSSGLRRGAPREVTTHANKLYETLRNHSFLQISTVCTTDFSMHTSTGREAPPRAQPTSQCSFPQGERHHDTKLYIETSPLLQGHPTVSLLSITHHILYLPYIDLSAVSPHLCVSPIVCWSLRRPPNCPGGF